MEFASSSEKLSLEDKQINHYGSITKNNTQNKVIQLDKKMSKCKHLIMILVLLCDKFFFSLIRRGIYPYVPVFSKHFGVSFFSISIPITGTNIVYPLGSLFSVTLKFHISIIMQFAFVLYVIAMFVIAFWNNSFLMFTVAFFMIGIGKGIANPTVQTCCRAFPEDLIGLSTGLVETSWGLVSLIGMPLFGIMMDYDMSLPYVVDGAALLFFAPVTYLLTRGIAFRGITKESFSEEEVMQKGGILSEWWILLIHPKAQILMVSTFALTFCSDLVMINFGVWLTTEHHYTFRQLASLTFIFGISDIVGELLCIKFLDRVSPIVFFLIGLIASLMSYIILPFVSGSSFPVWAALISIVVIFISFEAAIIAGQTLSSKLRGLKPGNLEAANFIIASIARSLAALVGPILWQLGKFPLCGGIAAGITATAFCFIVLRWESPHNIFLKHFNFHRVSNMEHMVPHHHFACSAPAVSPKN